jgi:tetraacyldisaccharide 4'-kinase
MSAQSWFNKIWYRRESPPVWLMPWSLLFGAMAYCRRLFYRHGLFSSIRITRPVVVIGNLTVGGTGKSPLVYWLVERLRESGWSPGIVTRGYRGAHTVPRLVTPADSVESAGDEPLMLARLCASPVAVGKDRSAAARLLVETGCDVIVSDDGLQHYRLARDCEIVVVDGDRRFGNGWLLPAGPMREAPQRLAEVDAVVVNGGTDRVVSELRMRLVATTAVSLVGSSEVPLNKFSGQSVHAVAGIGNPQRFFEMLGSVGMNVTGHALDDHARIGRQDIEFSDDSPVLMTEKDAVKCAGFADAHHWMVPVRACFDAADSKRLMDIVLARIRSKE